MWIFTRDGFFSAVQHQDEPDFLQVRARTRDDLERLGVSLGVVDDRAPFEIIEMRDADYRWRVNVDREVFAEYVFSEAMSLDYTTNVKGNLAGDDTLRKTAMMRVWSAMITLQDDEDEARGLTDDPLADQLDADADFTDLAWEEEHSKREQETADEIRRRQAGRDAAELLDLDPFADQ